MTFLDDAKYCAAVIHAADKYNKYGINVADEYDYIDTLEEEIKYDVTMSETDELVLTNRVFFFRHLVIKLCRDELGSDANIELFNEVSKVYKILGELIIQCHNRTQERYELMDSLVFRKNQVELMLNNTHGSTKLIYTLIYTEIEYIIRKYCKHEFVEK